MGESLDSQGRSGRIAKASAWSIAGKIGARVFDFASLLILAQLLAPTDFGLVAMAMTVILIVESVSYLPLTAPILRVEAPTPDVYDTAFTLSLLRALVIGLTVIALAWPVAAFFDEGRLPGLLCVLALAPMLRGSMSPMMAEFIRRYDTRPEFLIDLSSKFVALCVTASLALATRSYWAIAAGTVVTPLVMNVVSYVAAPYRPRFSLARWSVFADVIGWNFIGQVVQAFNWQMDRFLLGRSLSPSLLGRYTISSDLTGIPIQAMVVPATQPLATAFSQERTREGRATIWCKASNALLVLVGPFLVFISVLAQPIVLVLLGRQWQGTEVYLSWLALTVLPTLPGAGLGVLATACFQTRMATFRLIAEFVVKAPLTIVGIFYYGAMGAIAARGVVAIGMAVVSALAARQLTGASMTRQALAVWRTVVALGVMAVVLTLLRPHIALGDDSLLTRLIVGLELAGAFALGACAFVVVMAAIWMASGRPPGVEEVAVRTIRRYAGR